MMRLQQRATVAGLALTPRLLTLVVVGLLAASQNAHAQLTVSPSRVVHQAKPKQTLVGLFTVENGGESPLEVSVEPEDWSQGISGGRGRVGWLTVRPTKLTLQPGKSAKVKYTIRVPQDANGELRTQVFFTTTSTGRVTTRSRLGSIIYVAVEGTERIEGAITKVDAAYTATTPGVASPDRLDLVIRIHNHGNAHIVPEGTVVVRDSQGQAVATVPLPPGWGLLPNEEDAFHAIGPGVHLKPGHYTLDVTVFCGGDLRHPATVTKTVDAEVTKKGELRLIEPASPPPQ